jgi:Methane oxygenase PmoA
MTVFPPLYRKPMNYRDTRLPAPHRYLRMTFVGMLLSFSWAAILQAQEAPTPTASPMRIVPSDIGAGWLIYEGDKMFAGYVPDSNGRPIVYPVIGPKGDHMTRGYPMKPVGPHEKSDHPHHRSLWMTHGEVNEIDFWVDDERSGVIRQLDARTEVLKDGTAVITTENQWQSREGEPVCRDIRRFAFSQNGDRRYIDVDIKMRATESDVRFGDTKEGSFGLRVAGSMDVDAGLGGKITNEQGLENDAAWGQPASWVDYSGPVDNRPVGITIHSHPSSFGHPCRWHVRTYGLFAANPFGRHHFEGGAKRADIVLKKGQSMRLNYRVVLYAGAFDAERSALDFKGYSESPRPEIGDSL